jgi:hypothetical protein
MKKFLLGAAVGSVVGTGATLYCLMRVLMASPAAMAGAKHAVCMKTEDLLYGGHIEPRVNSGDVRPNYTDFRSYGNASVSGTHAR